MSMEAGFPAISSEVTDEPPITLINDALLDALQKQTSSTSQDLPELTVIDKIMAHRHLTSFLGFVVKHLHSVPHEQTETRKGQGVNLSNQLLRVLRSIKHQDWQFILTLDESRFSFAAKDGQIWLGPDQEPPERPGHMIEERKIMVIIARNASRFHLVQLVQKGMAFNAEDHPDNIRTGVIQFLPDRGGRQLVLHADKCCHIVESGFSEPIYF
jgi:hypothetical protein